MLTQDNKAEWMAGFSEGAAHVRKITAEYAHALVRYYAGESAEWAARQTAFHAGYVAALAAAVGAL